MSSFKIEVNEKEYAVEQQLIDDLMCTALEGGITYWCCRAEVPREEGYKGGYASDQISRGGSLILHDAEEDEVYVLTLDKFLKGLRLTFEQGYADAYEVLEEEDYDADTADQIVQLALFDDVVYG